MVVTPSYTIEAARPAGYPKFPARPPKSRSPRRRIIVSPPGRRHPDAFSGGETRSTMAPDRRPSPCDTFQPAPLDGVGSQRWISPQSSRETIPPPVAPVAPMPSFRSEEAVVREDSLANHWGCTVLVGNVKNSWQPVDHQMWGQKLHSDASDPFSQNPVFRPAGDGGARSIPREMVWLHSSNYRYTGTENNLVRHLPQKVPQYQNGGRDARPGLHLTGQPSMLTPRGTASASARTGVHGSSSGSQSCRVILPKLDANHISDGPPGLPTGRPVRATNHPEQQQLAEDTWIAAVLELHNRARAAHGAPPLVWSDECFELAKAQASQCAVNDLVTHGHLDGKLGRHGQNICVLQAVSPAAGHGRSGVAIKYPDSSEDDEMLEAAKEAVETWYEEVEDYQWEEPGFAGNTAHFSQLVWSETDAVGMAVVTAPTTSSEGVDATGHQAGRRYVVANYYPAGNVYAPGEFERNVLSCPENPYTETLLRKEFGRLAHLTPRADPPREKETVDDYVKQLGSPQQ